jgi:hypothetical protein
MKGIIAVCGICGSKDIYTYRDYMGVQYVQCNGCGRSRTHIRFIKKEDAIDVNDMEYLYRCRVCGKEHWDSLYNKPLCIHDNGIGYEMSPVYHPSHHEEPGAIRVRRERNES